MKHKQTMEGTIKLKTKIKRRVKL